VQEATVAGLAAASSVRECSKDSYDAQERECPESRSLLQNEVAATLRKQVLAAVCVVLRRSTC
jgi:hypothetical protein